ncbi:MAG: alpha/beta fold hydrolase, partial [Planctomycetaceae bacterium]|nr:alpha/beta fold hydrolase [Planctomycetaceae bacterium]
LDVEPHFLTEDDLDGRVFTSIGHGLGNRTEIVFRVAGKYLAADSSQATRLTGPSDFERGEEIRYQTSNGQFVISYKQGFPVGWFEPKPPPPRYERHDDLTYYRDEKDKRKIEIKNNADWQIRRTHILDNMQQVMGRLPGVMSRVPLDVRVLEEKRIGTITRKKISFQSDPYDRVRAWLLVPDERAKKRPAVLCLHQTVPSGKDEPIGLTGERNMHYALDLAKRGYVTLSPDYPSLGEHAYNFSANPEYISGTMKAIWDNIRAVDLLQSLPSVDADRIGVMGHSLGGHNAMFTAAFEPRLKVIISSCGFSTFSKDDVPSWTGRRYMPRIASVYKNDATHIPFDFPEIIATFTPRPFLACAATEDRDFDVTGVQDAIRSARPIYQLLGRDSRLQATFPESKHDFPPKAREMAFDFLDQHLRIDK